MVSILGAVLAVSALTCRRCGRRWGEAEQFIYGDIREGRLKTSSISATRQPRPRRSAGIPTFISIGGFDPIFSLRRR